MFSTPTRSRLQIETPALDDRFQCHSPILRFKESDSERIHFSELQLRTQFLFVRKFGNVYESGNAFFYRSESAVLVVFDDDCVHLLILLVFRSCGLPRVVDESFYGERNFSVFDFDDFHFHVVASLIASFRILDERPIHFRNVHQSLETFFELHEDAEFRRTRDDAFQHIAYCVFLDERCALRRSRAFFGEDELSFFRVRVDYHHLEFLADKLLQFSEYLVLVAVRNARVVRGGELRCRQESLDSVPSDDEPALVRFRYGKCEDGLLLDRHFCLVPNESLPGFAQAQLDIPLVLFRADDFRRYRVAEVNVLQGFARGKGLAAGNNAGAKRRQINEDPCATYRDDGTFHDIFYCRRLVACAEYFRHRAFFLRHYLYFVVVHYCTLKFCFYHCCVRSGYPACATVSGCREALTERSILINKRP